MTECSTFPSQDRAGTSRTAVNTTSNIRIYTLRTPYADTLRSFKPSLHTKGKAQQS